MTQLDRLSLNQATVNKLTVTEAVGLCVRHDIPAIGLWREHVAAAGLDSAAATVRAAGLEVSSLCRGGFFTHADPVARKAALEDNKAAIAEAAALGAGTLVLVSGGLVPGSRDIALARHLIADAIAELVPVAQAHGVRLAIEALHPVFAADRCVITRLGEALDLALTFPADAVGIVVDTYHLWWDPDVWDGIARAGAEGRIALFQVADWVTPLPEGVLTGRGMLGDGRIELRRFREAVDATGYTGPIEVEIFNDELWAMPGPAALDLALSRFAQHVV